MIERTAEYLRARRAYEVGRLLASMRRAVLVAAPIAMIAWLVVGRASLIWLPVTFVAWIVAYFRGEATLQGAFYGLAGGVVTFLLPMSILRPCCAPGAAMTADCCTMPGACLAAGGVVGVIMAAMVPFGKAAWWRTTLGMAAGLASVAVLKCATLFAGEAVGLVGGLVAGLLAASAARSLVGRRSQT